MKAFISYAHKDEDALRQLMTHLAILEREGGIEAWFDRRILAGSEIDREIDERLESCELFLALVSPDFLDSDYCYSREMQRALERHEAGETRIIPIIIEPCDWLSTPLGQFKALPKDGRSIAEWDNSNAAYLDVVKELRRIPTTRKEPFTLDPVWTDVFRQRFGQVRRTGTLEDAAAAGIHQRSRTGREGQRPEPGPPVGTQAARPPSAAERYRVQRDFDEIDRAEFRETTYRTIREHFEKEVRELNSLNSVRARLTERSGTSFSCTVVNRARMQGAAHITIHAGGSNMSFGDVSYSFSEHSPSTTANGFFSIDSDEYELFLQPLTGSGDDRNRLTPQDVAELLWQKFIVQAGISLTP
ncbi:MAG: toll/interleukin-1 receptor domain-containing protein [Gammaproteobacteria bacterium]|nr:toll/interleukin-1 receptor domain-containing protein [Gammaproteobacteria bacterium]